MKLPSIHPIEKHVVLVGAGNAHLVFARRWGMKPVPGVAVTLVSEAPTIAYSAMVPGRIGGEYRADEITIDLVRFCRAVKVRLVSDRVTGIDPIARQVAFASRPSLAFDVLSLGLGSLPALPPLATERESSFVMRPLQGLLDRLDSLEENLRACPRPFHLVVVGGGASGCELAIAVQKRFAGFTGFRLTLLQGNAKLVPNFPDAVARAFAEVFQARGIAWRTEARVVGWVDNVLSLENAEQITADATLWATEAAAPALLRESGMAVSAAGFLRVEETLQSVSDPAVFGTGDCVTFDAYPDLQKNGVLAVKQGRILFDNVLAVLKNDRPRPFVPQPWCLCLMNLSDGRAVANYGAWTATGRWARWLKDRIDRAWMATFQRFAPMTPPGPAEYTMRCGGCGSKVAGDVLAAGLRRLDVGDDPRILLGCRDGEDAAVHRVRPESFGSDPAKLVEVQTVDFFKAFIDDPYLFGRVAALHAVSDLYAMNARPFSALAIATLPYARGPIQEAMLFEMLSGSVASFRELGVVLTGGHTTEGTELALGFSVTGHGEEDRLFRKGGLRPGDLLVLTKPLGTGALLAAWMRGACQAEWFAALTATMLTPNAAAAAVFAEAGVRGCTDVTGFGLAGHLLEMLDASDLSARLNPSVVPLLPGFPEVAEAGFLSSLHPDNVRLAHRIHGSQPAWLFDPQTSGGLLAGVEAGAVDRVVSLLRTKGYSEAGVIGEVFRQPPLDRPRITLESRLLS